MNYEPNFLKPSGVAFPPLLPERWSNYPTANQLFASDALFYKSPEFDPVEKSEVFRKAVVADWASDVLKNNRLYFNTYPLESDTNIVDRLRQIQYAGELGFDDSSLNYLSPVYRTEDDDSLRLTQERLTQPYRVPQELLQHLIVPFTAGVGVYRDDLPTNREWFLENYKQHPNRDFVEFMGNKYFISKEKEKMDRLLEKVRNPKYFGQAGKAMREKFSEGENRTITQGKINPTEEQQRFIDMYRQEIDKLSGQE